MEVGDVVKVKENLEVDKRYGDEIFVGNMKKYRGKQARITGIYTYGYELDIDDGKWTWSDDMLEPNEEIKMKFNVGDIVKIKENLKAENLYGKIMFASTMEEYCGKQAEIAYVGTHGYKLNVDKGEYIWTDSMLEPSKKYEVIVEGNTVIVRDSKGNEGIAKCSPDDEFNLSTGISLAISRLRWKPSFGERYYSIYLAGKNLINWFNWTDDDIDNTIYERGLVFKTKEEAEEAAKTMLDSIRGK